VRQNVSMPAFVAPPAFALAKIQPPKLRTDLVDRDALDLALQHALQSQRLVLLLAPAGYGKTVALTQQLRKLPATCALAWISADENDHLQRFLECLSIAVEPYDLPWRMAPDALATLALTEHGLRDAAGELVNALAGADAARGLIVVDDAHRIADPRVWKFLQAAIERLPAAWGLVISSRVEPPLPLARLRAAGELSEFRQTDLRFNEAEIKALLARSGSAAPTTSASELLERTDGWAAGLRLSLSARQGGASLRLGGPATRHVFDYLAAEVLDDMPKRLRDFLLRCAVLPELTAARCVQVSGDPQAAILLDQIERRGLFVSVLDSQELTLRLHDLFRDFLEDRLARDHADELPALLRRAAAHEDDLARAFGYLVRAGAWDEAARALMAGGPSLLASGGGASVEQMLGQIPADELSRLPDMHLLRGFLAFNRYDWDTLLAAMQRAAKLYAQAGVDRLATMARAFACAGLHHVGRPEEAETELAALRGLPLDDGVRAVVCYIGAWHDFSRERVEAIEPQVSVMLDALNRLADLGLWHQCANLSLFVGLPGMTVPLERVADTILLQAGEVPTQLRVGAMHTRAVLALAKGKVDDAWQWLQRADADCRWLGNPRLLLTDNAFIHLLMHALRGEVEAYRATMQAAWHDMQHDSARSHRRVHEADLITIAARACWILQDEDGLRQMDAALRRAGNDTEWVGAARCRALSSAFMALIDQRLGDALSVLTPLANDIERHMFFPATQARVMLAAVQLELGDADAAAATLLPWLTAADHTGNVGAGLLAGPRMLTRLAHANWGHRIGSEGVALLQRLSRLSQPVHGRGALVPPAAVSAVGPGVAVLALSTREREVLERMAAGDSNKLIARAFDLSPHTVKRHVANILDKIGVASRGQAAAWYRSSALGHQRLGAIAVPGDG